MDDYRDLEEDYVRRLQAAQERGDTRPVPLVDESRVCHSVRMLSVKDVIEQTRRFLTKEGLGGVRP